MTNTITAKEFSDRVLTTLVPVYEAAGFPVEGMIRVSKGFAKYQNDFATTFYTEKRSPVFACDVGLSVRLAGRAVEVNWGGSRRGTSRARVALANYTRALEVAEFTEEFLASLPAVEAAPKG